MVPSSQSQFGGMDSTFQQLSQLLYLQSLASPSVIKSPMINPQFGQMPMIPKMPSMTQLPLMPSQSSSNQSNHSALENITKILSAHQNLKSQLSPISSRSKFNPQMMPSFNTNDFSLSQFQAQFQHQNETQQRQPEYRIAVTKESAKPLQDWMKENLHHPYPTSADIFELSKKTGFSHKQIRNWFTNNRRRYEQENSEKPLPWQKKLASNRKSSSPENVNSSSSISDNIISQISQFITPSKTPESN